MLEISALTLVVNSIFYLKFFLFSLLFVWTSPRNLTV